MSVPVAFDATRKPAQKKKFSIFNPAITFEHREFYERIITELNGIFPICSQGESAAVEVSENETEQQQVIDLMKQVENFAHELIDVTKELFDQFYQAKEDLYTALLTTTAFNKINLMDRNLLERTCDVRWWALETAFSECITFFSQVCGRVDRLLHHLDEYEAALKSGRIDMDMYLLELITAVRNFFPAGEGRMNVLIQYPVFTKFCEQANRLQQEVRVQTEYLLGLELLDFVSEISALHEKISFSCDRLEDINSSYTLYRELVVVDLNGYIIATSNKKNRNRVLGMNVSEEAWFLQALKTQNGTQYYAQDVAASQVETQKSLVYSTAIRENSDENGKAIGVMGVFFDFQGEANLILNGYMPRDEQGNILEGCYSLFTNQEGVIIASSDDIILEVGTFAHIPTSHRKLAKGQKYASYAVFEGTESAILSAKTDGYLEYQGLGWNAHVIIPKADIFKSNDSGQTLELNTSMLISSELIPEINKRTYVKVQDDKESIQLISLNGIVFASKLGKRGVALRPIFEQITKTGSFATHKMEELLAEMALGVLDLHLKALANFSKQAIDLIDRNLFERSADVRWWATDKYFWKALQHPSEESYQAAANRLRVINSSYTMYRNIVLVDRNGEFVASSHNELKNELKLRNYADQSWFQDVMRTTSSSKFCVQDVSKSNLESKKEVSLIYAGGIRTNGAREGEAIGVLAILFDWDNEAGKILHSCLPQGTDGEVIQDSVGFYTNKKGIILETTDPERFPLGKKIDLPLQFTSMAAGESVSGFITFHNKQYILGSSKTQGYREYEGLGWCAHIMRPVY